MPVTALSVDVPAALAASNGTHDLGAHHAGADLAVRARERGFPGPSSF